MTLSPQERKHAVELAARMLADEAKEAAGGILELMVMPMQVASQMLAMSPARIKTHLQTTRTLTGKHGVTLGTIQRHIQARTVFPKILTTTTQP